MSAKAVQEDSKSKKLKERAHQNSNKSASPDKKDKGKKNTSLRLDKKTLKSLKILAIEKDTSVQKLIEKMIHDYIEEHS